MDEQQEPRPSPKPEPKISFVLGVIGLIVFVVFDILSIIPGAADILDIPDTLIILVGWISGLGTLFTLTEGIIAFLKLFPLVQEFPLWTIAWCVVWYIESHPSKLTTAVELAVDLKGGKAGAAKDAAGAEKTLESGAKLETTREIPGEGAEVQGTGGGRPKTEGGVAGGEEGGEEQIGGEGQGRRRTAEEGGGEETGEGQGEGGEAGNAERNRELELGLGEPKTAFEEAEETFQKTPEASSGAKEEESPSNVVSMRRKPSGPAQEHEGSIDKAA